MYNFYSNFEFRIEYEIINSYSIYLTRIESNSNSYNRNEFLIIESNLNEFRIFRIRNES
ncbi:hypothetical protein HanIR_Chr12g0578901 [Helianthus annuus]|nr:hypothetical protein HanIR_Chr12g0578901 [Helianthus annuus]